MTQEFDLDLLDLDKMYPNAMLLDYLQNKKPMSDFFAGKNQKLHSVNFTGDRGILQEILIKYSKSIQASVEVFANIEMLANDNVKFVITGQQPGLLTGPMYTIYKTLAAIIYAEKFSTKDLKLIPLFWNASEDHDVEEVNNIRILNKQNEVVPVVFEDDSMHGKSLESIDIDKSQCTNILAYLLESFPNTEFTDEIFNKLIKGALNKSTKWGAFFSRLMSKLMSEWGLILIEPKIFRPYLTDYFSRVTAEPEKFNNIFLNTTGKLTDLGYQPKMHKKENVVGLFYIDSESKRNSIIKNAKKEYEIANGEILTQEEILNQIKSTPERFSTNAIFRPLAQDLMLPTQIFVGGPSEIGYHIQIKDLYKEFSLQQPNLMFRMGATIIERHINRIMEKYSFNITELREINQLTNRLVRIESDDIIGKYSTNIATKLDEMNTELSAVNQELGKRSEFRKQSIMKELTNIEKMYLKYIKSENKVLLSQLSKARAYLFPSDKPQERIFNIFQYLNKYSITLLNCMKDLLAKNDPGNHVVLKCWMF